ncbi:MAG: hypothetical protein ABMB14_14915 [Myxococcota bacterium]
MTITTGSSVGWSLALGLGGVIGSGALATGLGWLAELALGWLGG